MKFIYKAIVIICAAGGTLFAGEATGKQHAEEIFEEANRIYIEENYQKAVELYESILDSGFESAALYYNLGNAYLQEGMVGMAILNYERALIIDPSDEDAKYNLRIADSRITGTIDPVPRLFFHKWHDSLVGIQSADAWAKTLIVLSFLFSISFAVFLLAGSKLYKKTGFFAALIILLFSLVSFYSAKAQYRRQTERNMAVVVEEYALLRSAPTGRSTELFRIYEGNRLRLTDTIGEWCEVRLPDGNIGWIECSALKVI